MAGYIVYNDVVIRWFPRASDEGRADIKAGTGFVSFDTLAAAKQWIDDGQHVGDMPVHAL